MFRLFLLISITMVTYGCSATAMINQLKFVPVNPEKGHSQVQDEAQCRKEFHEYRAGINSNWLNDEVYKDCMIAKGYKELK